MMESGLATTTTTPSDLNKTHLSFPYISKFRTACRRKVERTVHVLNTTHILGRIPVLNILVLAFEMAIVAQLIRRYDHHFGTRPIVTMMVTNSVLNGIADTVAQTVTVLRRRPASNNAIQLASPTLDEKLPHFGSELIPTHSHTVILPPPFDFERLVRFAGWGFIVAPVQFKWLQLLQHSFPLTKAAATVPALKRVLADQTVFAPLGLLGFFTYMTYAEGGGADEARKRLGLVYAPTLKANYLLWPAVQLLNFRVMPLQFQLPFASTVGIAWGTYLSLTNSSTDP